LWLVSIQLTGAGFGGTSLPEFVAEITKELSDASAVDQFRAKLAGLNWQDDAAASYPRRLRLRSAPEIYQVDERFPAITSEVLTRARIDQSRITQLKYEIDLGGIPASGCAPSIISELGNGGIS
jgi:hypothetical protein